MSYFAVVREAGPAWTDGKGIFEQAAVNDHATFMDALAAEGFVLFGGPVAGTEHGRLRALLVFNAADESDIDRRLADDPWVSTGHLVTTSIEPWNLLVGGERLPAAQAAND